MKYVITKKKTNKCKDEIKNFTFEYRNKSSIPAAIQWTLPQSHHRGNVRQV